MKEFAAQPFSLEHDTLWQAACHCGGRKFWNDLQGRSAPAAPLIVEQPKREIFSWTDINLWKNT
jgi:hypothetical protein